MARVASSPKLNAAGAQHVSKLVAVVWPGGQGTVQQRIRISLAESVPLAKSLALAIVLTMSESQ